MDGEKDITVPEEMTREAERIWEDPQKIMRLIDLLFLLEDPDKKQVCS